MSVEHEAVAMYGIWFPSSEAMLSFINSNGYPEIDTWDEDMEEFEMNAVCLNAFVREPTFILGVHVGVGETLDNAKRIWAKHFPNSTVTPETHLEVKTY